ncbi:SDR family NAD(P)-dependent oxidoreductase [Phytohabitans suffuscus]|uniref:Retinol dehydrogenase n=1 Tax=Phytohabitans suffuscus TaxID=624315 RepID=A0A6F8YXG3_9ACTN|nr:SDR family NAD(P)-dependent oxidoreductase [Phytohabitans suffuscus]BCB90779.1 retinol dehydrogenase [Phytohabitans suffuscus]
MSGRKRAVVTGATGGIGEAIARRLAAAGMGVVLFGRDEGRLRAARERVAAAVPGAELWLERADLSLMAQVRDLAGRLAERPPDVVVSNAAVIAGLDERTPEGLPRTLATNHLAPYLLLRSLVAPIGSRPARFVVVGADPRGLRHAPVDLDDLRARRGLGPVPSLRPFVAYGRTKNMNAMFAYALARRLAGTGSGITVNGAHPGIIKDTGLGAGTARGALWLLAAAIRLNPATPGPDTGADTPAWLATASEVEGVTGRFFVGRAAVGTAPHTTDVARCDRLWDESARLVGLPA